MAELEALKREGRGGEPVREDSLDRAFGGKQRRVDPGVVFCLMRRNFPNPGAISALDWR